MLKSKKNAAETAPEPLLKALKETLIYLKEQPHLDASLQQELDELIQSTEELTEGGDSKKLEKKIRQFLFKLEFHDQDSDLGREKILRRLAKSLIDLHLEDEDSPFHEQLIEIRDGLETSALTRELEELRGRALDTVVKANMWHSEAQKAYSAEVTALATRLLTILKVPDLEFGEINEQIDHLLALLQEGGADVYTLRNINRRLDGLLDDYRVVSSHFRKERQELLEVISTLIASMQTLDSGHSLFSGGLDKFVQELREAKKLESINALREKIIEEAQSMQQRARESAQEIQTLHKRIIHAQSRVLILEEEVQKLRNTLAEALKMRDLDTLTGIPNRRAFDLESRNAFETFMRHKTPCCLALVDVDHFKKINDTYGHQTGDKVLQSVARLLRSKLRRIDFLARYGGEEFAIILPNTTLRGAVQVMERVRKTLNATEFLTRGNKIRVTASFGISELHLDSSIESWIENADRALYRAKDTGRNKICLEEERMLAC